MWIIKCIEVIQPKKYFDLKSDILDIREIKIKTILTKIELNTDSIIDTYLFWCNLSKENQ